ncbi:MAG: hypothetical protein AAGF92_00910 [Myxococcota bacterium]
MKRRLVIAFVVLLTIWPLAHRAMVAAFNVNPWKLAGWAMFCIPNPKTSTQTYGLTTSGRRIRFEMRPEDQFDLSLYDYRRQILGELAPPPDRLAEQILSRHPELAGVGVVVYQYHLDPETALLRWESEEGAARR